MRTCILKLLGIFFAATFCLTIQAQEQKSNLPTFYIATENKAPVNSKEIYTKGTLTVKSSDNSEVLTNVVTEIRGRGNSTWGMSKKPYRLKLDKKTQLLNLPAKEKNWVLLANYADKTLMRNAVALKTSQLLGLEFTPSCRFVDVVLNDEFLGNYILTDQVEVADFRVPVEKQKTDATTEPDITGGYLLEIDGFAAAEPVWFTTPQGLAVTIKYPKDDEINASQRAYITNYINAFENVLFSSNFKDPKDGYRAWVDVASLVNWYIACELTGNSDSFWSTYIYKKNQDDKIYFGPMWDYDIAFNNDDRLGDAVNKLMRENAHNPRKWIERICQDEWFLEAVDIRWQELVAGGIQQTLVDYIDETALLLEQSQTLNFQKWDVLNKKVYRETFLFKTYKEGVDYLKKYVKDRIQFLSKSFAVPEPVKPSEEFVAENYYYMIMNKRTGNVIQPSDDSVDLNAPLSLWDASSDDDSQLWEITSLGDDLFRIVNKKSGYAMAGSGRGQNLKQVAVQESDASQKWKIVAVHTGDIYGIVNASSDFSVNNSGGSFEEGTAVIEYDNNIHLVEKENQHWYFIKNESVPQGIERNEVFDLDYRIDGGVLTLQNLLPETSVKIFNLQGQPVFAGKNEASELSVSLPMHGVYIISVASHDGVRYYKVFIK